MSILRVSVILTAIALLSRALGLVRDLVITWAFGATQEADSFYIASSVSNAAYVVLTTSLISAVIPFLSKHTHEATETIDHQAVSNLFNATSILLILLTLTGMLFSGGIAGVLNPGAGPDMRLVTSEFIMALMPSVALLGCAGIFGGMLNFNKIFIPVALGPVVLNLSAILGIVLLKEPYGIRSAVIGTLVGSVLFLALQIPKFYTIDFHLSWRVSFADKKTRAFLATMVPIVGVAFISYAQTFVDLIMGSRLGEGVVTAINVANKLIQLPQGIIAMGLTTAAFPVISRMTQNNDMAGASVLVSRLSRIVTLLSLFSCALIMVQPDLIVSVVFGRGTFSHEAVQTTARILSITALSLPAFSLAVILLRVLYAVDAGRIAFIGFTVALIVKAFTGFGLAPIIGVDAVAISTLIATSVNALLIMYYLHGKLGGAFGGPFLSGALKSLLASALIFSITFAFRKLFAQSVLARYDMVEFLLVTMVSFLTFAICVMTFLKSEAALIRSMKQ